MVDLAVCRQCDISQEQQGKETYQINISGVAIILLPKYTPELNLIEVQ